MIRSQFSEVVQMCYNMGFAKTSVIQRSRLRTAVLLEGPGTGSHFFLISILLANAGSLLIKHTDD